MGALGAIVVAGGESRRFGEDKLALRHREGKTLLDLAVGGAAEHADLVIVVGPEREVEAEVLWIREDPPGGGPCAALAAGLTLLGDEFSHVAVLAGDAPGGGAAIPALRQVIDDAAAAVVVDAFGREQPLTAVYAVGLLRETLAHHGDCRDLSMRSILDELRPWTIVTIVDRWSAAVDIDTRHDAESLGFGRDSSA